MRRISYHVVDGTRDVTAGDVLASELVAGGFTVYAIREAREGATSMCPTHTARCQRWTLFVEPEGHATESEMQTRLAEMGDDRAHFMRWDYRGPRR